MIYNGHAPMCLFTHDEIVSISVPQLMQAVLLSAILSEQAKKAIQSQRLI